MPLACSRRHLGGSEPMHRARQFSQSFLGYIFKGRPAKMDMEKPPAWFHWSSLFLVNLAAPFEDCFSGYMSIFSVPGSCLMQVQYLNDGGLVSLQQKAAKDQVETRQEPICPVHIMTLEISSEQTRPHTVWHGHGTPLGTGPLRGGS